jgi:putative membrane protein insertion efficiency factor
LLFLVRAYQLILGPFLGGACRFYPSCSNYALQAIERHGARRGTALTVKRVLRCRPFSPGGVDLVPAREDLLRETREAVL